MAGHDHTPAIHAHADAWHHHSSAEGAPQHEHASIADAGALARWIVLIILTMGVVILALVMYFKSYATQRRAAIVETINSSAGANTARADAEARLGSDGHPLSQYQYGFADKPAHKVQLPIEQAMQKTVERYQNQKPAPHAAK